jgi:hypothetical protein
MSFEAAKAVIDNTSIGFSCLEDLNDPFECTAFGFLDDDGSKVTAKLATNACKNRFSRNYGVLSLTRQPLNSLMWSHYGDEHQGVVLGFDVDIAGFSSLDTCVIPNQYGEVIYSATKPHKDLPIISEDTLKSIGNQLKFDPGAFNLIKIAFLYKCIEWGYEEEVRVVKNISAIPLSYHSGLGRHDKWTKISIAGRPLYCIDIPETSIKEIYLGRHIFKNVNKKKTLTQQELENTIKSWGQKDIKLMQCNPDVHSWKLVAVPSDKKS